MACYRYALALGLVLVSPIMLSAPDQLGQAARPEGAMPANPLIEQAVEDLAQREAVLASAIEVVSFEAVTWPDTSMGCPHPDMRYQQVPQDGARIVLRLKGALRVYHSGGRRGTFLCEYPTDQASPRLGWTKLSTTTAPEDIPQQLDLLRP